MRAAYMLSAYRAARAAGIPRSRARVLARSVVTRTRAIGARRI